MARSCPLKSGTEFQHLHCEYLLLPYALKIHPLFDKPRHRQCEQALLNTQALQHYHGIHYNARIALAHFGRQNSAPSYSLSNFVAQKSVPVQQYV